ncbi:tail fiber protein [Photorhabdus sp. P32]|uniref:tail fiber protein n=1 Tax=Photorhabdus sp. P32 TaxID=3117549 RepID=UPI00311AE1A6
MEKKHNIPNIENADIASKGPTTDELKNRFKAGSIPLQTDYSDLIDIADIGRKATGQAPGQPDNPTSALELDGTGWLMVKVDPTGGLKRDIKGLSVKLQDASLVADDKGLKVNYGRGLYHNEGKLEVDNHDGIEIVSEGVKVKAGDGINVDGNGVSVKKGNGINVDQNGVSIDPNKVLPRGVIVMFSGDSAPTGWAFCDGTNGTPDLRSRFVMCGDDFSDKGNSGNKASGSGSGKNYSRDTTLEKVDVTVTVQNTTLTVDQIPSHKHTEGMAYSGDKGVQHGSINTPQNKYQINVNDPSPVWVKYGSQSPQDFHFYTSSIGGGQGHNHQATASSSSHDHSIDVVPPYYLLAFIMKL